MSLIRDNLWTIALSLWHKWPNKFIEIFDKTLHVTADSTERSKQQKVIKISKKASIA